MKGHLTEKTLIKTALAGHEAVAGHPHISTCPRCRSRAEEYLTLLSPSKESIPEPSPAVERRILKTYRDVSTEKSRKSRKVTPLHLPGPRGRLILAGSTAAAAVMLIIFSLFTGVEKPTGPHLSISPREKNILVNNTTTTSSHIVAEGIHSVNIKGASLVTRQDFFSVSLYRHSELTITGLKKDALPHPLVMMLKKGTLTADIKKLNRKYIFLTSDARILITGTRFKLTAADYTTLDLTEGSVDITALASGKTLSLCAGNSCRITPDGRISTFARKPVPVKIKKDVKKVKGDTILHENPKETRDDPEKISQEKILHEKEVKRNRHEMGKIKRSFRPGRNR